MAARSCVCLGRGTLASSAFARAQDSLSRAALSVNEVVGDREECLDRIGPFGVAIVQRTPGAVQRAVADKCVVLDVGRHVICLVQIHNANGTSNNTHVGLKEVASKSKCTRAREDLNVDSTTGSLGCCGVYKRRRQHLQQGDETRTSHRAALQSCKHTYLELKGWAGRLIRSVENSAPDVVPEAYVGNDRVRRASDSSEGDRRDHRIAGHNPVSDNRRVEEIKVIPNLSGDNHRESIESIQ